MINKVILMGRLCADPELRQTQNGVSVCRFRIAVNRPYQKDKEQTADFISCTAWRNTADFVQRYFSKGRMIIVEGALRNADYTDANGVKHYAMDVLVDNVAFGENKNARGTQQASMLPMPHRDSRSPKVSSDTLDDLNGFEDITDGDTPF